MKCSGLFSFDWCATNKLRKNKEAVERGIVVLPLEGYSSNSVITDTRPYARLKEIPAQDCGTSLVSLC